jgi:hypothetical protein
LFIEEAFLSLGYVFGAFMEDQLAVDARTYFCVHCSVLLVYVLDFMPAPCCFGYHGFVVCLEVRYCASSFVLFA